MLPRTKKIGALFTAMMLIASLVALGRPMTTSAKSGYASATGQACGVCHVDPAGGGTRTAIGDAFAAIPTHSTDPVGAWALVSNPAPTPTPTPRPEPSPTPAASPSPAPSPTPDISDNDDEDDDAHEGIGHDKAKGGDDGHDGTTGRDDDEGDTPSDPSARHSDPPRWGWEHNEPPTWENGHEPPRWGWDHARGQEDEDDGDD